MTDEIKACKNCNQSIKSNYCENCGQRTSINKVTFKETFQDFVDMVFSVNAPLMLTLKMLIVNPGKLFREYLAGKRKKFYKPVAFFILTTIVFVLLKALLNFDPMANMAVAGDMHLNQSLFNDAGIYMAKNSNNFIFIFVFSFAIMVKMFFYKKYSFVEYLAISFYIIGFYVVITTVLMPWLKYLGPKYNMISMVFMFFYVIYAMLSFFKKIIIGTIFKIFMAFFISLILYMFFGYGTSFLIVWLKTQ
jgi:hypothetical protein